MKLKKLMRSNINKRIIKSLQKVSFVLLILFFTLSFGKISGTNSFFSDSAAVEGNTLAAGYWIPTLTMSVEAPGADGWYEEAPCVTLSTNIHGETSGITIYYEFSDDGNPFSGGTVYPGTCVNIPDGNPTNFQAQAVNDENEDWKSNIVSEDFKIYSPAEAGDVIINEVMWTGSNGKAKDKWIELKNVSAKDIHIKDWYLTYKSDAGNELELLEIGDNRIIKSGEYYLASYYTKNNSAINVNPDSNDLNDFDYNKFQIKLYTSDDKSVLIDTAGDGTQEPPEGDQDNFYSMERKNIPGDGSSYGNWYTCLDASSTGLYWDDDRAERGTPGAKNLSKNDPTADDYEPDAEEPAEELVGTEQDGQNAEQGAETEEGGADNAGANNSGGQADGTDGADDPGTDETDIVDDGAAVEDIPEVIEEPVVEPEEEPAVLEEPEEEAKPEPEPEPEPEEDANPAGTEGDV